MGGVSICVLGGTGFVGSHLVTRLMAGGHRVKVLTRNREAHRHLLVLPDVDLVNANVHDPRQLAQHFAGTECVINLVGILNERGRGGQGFRRVHVDLPRRVMQAARSARVRRVLHMSALGANPDGPSHYLRTKGEGEQVVRREAESMEFVIFRPSVIFGPGDSFVTRFARLGRILPLAFPLARANAKFAPVYVEDVTHAFERCLRSDGVVGTTLELCGPQVYTLRQVVELTLKAAGLRRRVFGLPDFLARLQAFVMDFVPGKPFSTDNFRSLTIDNVCRENALRALGVQQHSMPAILPRYLGRSAILDAYRHDAKR